MHQSVNEMESLFEPKWGNVYISFKVGPKAGFRSGVPGAQYQAFWQGATYKGKVSHGLTMLLKKALIVVEVYGCSSSQISIAEERNVSHGNFEADMWEICNVDTALR